MQFPFGVGAIYEKRKQNIDQEEIIDHYSRLSLPQFHRQDFSLVLFHMLNRIKSFKSGIIKCRAMLNGVNLAERISTLTPEEISSAASRKDLGVRPNFYKSSDAYIHAVTTSCNPMGHSKEAASKAR